MINNHTMQVYQIRHILGMAVAVANKLVPLEFVEASLSIHARCNLPKAPPSTLVLSGSTFAPFPITEGGPHPVCSLSGPSLSLRAQGQAQQSQFRDEASTYQPLLPYSHTPTLLPHMVPMLITLIPPIGVGVETKKSQPFPPAPLSP